MSIWQGFVRRWYGAVGGLGLLPGSLLVYVQDALDGTLSPGLSWREHFGFLGFVGFLTNVVIRVERT